MMSSLPGHSAGVGFHAGEEEAQRLSETSAAARQLGPMLGSSIALGSGIDALLNSLRVAFVASLGAGAAAGDPPPVWVSPVFGPAGFVRAPHPGRLEIDLNGGVHDSDVLWENVSGRDSFPVAFLAMNLRHRRRYRTNGVARVQDAGGTMAIEVKEAFPNCPKYIQSRSIDPESASLPPLAAPKTRRRPDPRSERGIANKLSLPDINLIASADTFFMGTYYHGTGADVSHRGGNTGFVRVASSKEIWFPDYKGNGMFQSFGNILQNDRAGLCFLSFETGEVLQLTGRAIVEWQQPGSAMLESRENRVVRFLIDEVRRIPGHVTNYRWRLEDASPYNPVIPSQDLVPSQDFIRQQSLVAAADEDTFAVGARLVEVVAESPDVKAFRFLAAKRIKFLPGQYATFQFEDAPAIGATKASPLIRTWTLSNTSSSASGEVNLEISVKRKPGGLVSSWLHDQALPGLRVKVVGIDGDLTPFSLPTMPSKVLLVSGGIGITPNLAILRGIEKYPCRRAGDRWEPDVAVLHQERNANALVFQDELLRLRAALPGFRKLITLVSGSECGERLMTCRKDDDDDNNRDNDKDKKNTHVERGRLALPLLREQIPDAAERTVYLCGPSGFMQAAREHLEALGVDSRKIHTEEFNF